jgi:hypothetical protein
MNALEKLQAEFEAYKRETQQKLEFFDSQIKRLQHESVQTEEEQHTVAPKIEQNQPIVSNVEVANGEIVKEELSEVPGGEGISIQNQRTTYIEKLIKERKVQEPPQQKMVERKPFIERLEAALPPVLGEGFEYIKSTYLHYKSEGKLQVFFMTIAGIAAILFGSGYLLQYAFTTWFVLFTPLVKTLLGFTITTALGYTGLNLFRKKESFREYGSALIALSLCLNYLLIYFLVSSYGEGTLYYLLGYIFMIVNTLLLLLAASYTETKVIAILTLLGGTFSPVFIHGESTPVYYYIHLWILYALLIWLSIRIRWETLRFVTIVCGLFVIETGIFLETAFFDEMWLAVISHAFVYLFVYAMLSKGLRSLRNDLALKETLLFVSVVVVHCFNLYYISGFDYSSNILALIYWLNAIPFSVFVYLRFKILSKPYRAILFNIIGSLIGLGIAVLFDKEYISLFWSVEALLLMVVGSYYGDRLIRKEAFIVYILAIIQSIVLIPELQSSWESSFYWGNWLPFVGLWLISFGSYYTLIRNKIHLNADEAFLTKFYLEFTVLLGSVIFLLPFYWYFALWAVYPLSVLLFINLLVSRNRQVSVSLVFHYVVLGVGLFYILNYLVNAINIHWDQIWEIDVFYQFLGISIVLFAGYLATDRWLKEKYKLLSKSLLQSAFLLLGLNLILIGLSLLGAYFYPASLVISMPYLFLSTKIKSKLLSGFSYLAFGFLLLGYVISMQETGEFHFAAQMPYAKICIVEIGVVLFYLQSINSKWLKQQKYLRPFFLLRTVFYLLVPFVVITGVNRHFHDFLPHAMWISVLIVFANHERTKRKALVYEFYLILGLSTLISVLMQDVPAFFVALLVVFGIQYYKKGFQKIGLQDKDWSKLFAFNYYFLGLVIYLGLLKFLDANQLISLSCLSIYFLALMKYRSVLPPLWKHEKVLHLLSSTSLLLAVVVSWIAQATFLDTIGFGVIALNFGLYIYFVYQYRVKYLRGLAWQITIFFIHISVGLFYYQILTLLFPVHIQTYLTVTLVLHGIILLFHTLGAGWVFLRLLYIPLFALVFLKLFFYDLQGFSIIQKVLVLILSGVLFLVGAWAFIKLKEKYVVRSR